MIRPYDMIRRSVQLVYRELPEGAGLLHLETDSFYTLNSTGALIWELIENGVVFEELVALLASTVVESPTGLFTQVSAFLDEMAERGLVEIVSPPG